MDLDFRRGLLLAGFLVLTSAGAFLLGRGSARAAGNGSELGKDALRAVWEGIAHTHDLDRTLEFLPGLGPGSNKYSEPYEIWDLYMTLHDLYRIDDRKVIAWVEELPPGEVRNRAFHSIVDQLARHDPLAAKEWIEQQADDGNRSEAYVELAESWDRRVPAATPG